MMNPYKPYHLMMLEDELHRRKRDNPNYSLRAFARDLDIGSSTLSRILTGAQELSISAANLFMDKLNFSQEQRLIFVASVAEEKKQRAIDLLSQTLQSEEHSEKGHTKIISLEWILAKSPDYIFVLNRDNRCIFVNEAAARLHNMRPNQLIGKTMEEVGTPEEVLYRINQQLENVKSSRGPLRVEDAFATRDGFRWFERFYMPFMSSEGEVQAIVTHFRDVTDRKRAEQKITFLTEAGTLLSTSTDLRSTLSQIVDLAIADFADGCFIHLKEADGAVKIVKVAHTDKSREDHIRSLFERFPYNPEIPAFYHKVFASGEAQYNFMITDAFLRRSSQDLPHYEALSGIGGGSYICVPMNVNEETIGTITVLRSRNREAFTKHDVDMAQELGLRAGFALNYLELKRRLEQLRRP